MFTLTVNLPDSLKSWVDARIAENDFGSPSAYVLDMICRDQETHPEYKVWLTAELDKGLKSGVCEKDAFEVLDEIIAESRLKHTNPT